MRLIAASMPNKMRSLATLKLQKPGFILVKSNSGAGFGVLLYTVGLILQDPSRDNLLAPG